MIRRRTRGLLRALVGALTLAVITPACAGHRAPVIVGQTGHTISASVDKVSAAVESLTAQKVIPPQTALTIQQNLQAVNARLKPLPGLLRTIEKIQATDTDATDVITQAIAILDIVGQDISITIAGVPISDTTKSLIELIRATTRLIQDTLVEVASIREGQ